MGAVTGLREQVGVDASLPQRLREAVEREIEAGQIRGFQVFVARHGHVVVDEAFGERSDGGPVSTDTRFPVFSSSKPVTGTALHMLFDRGRLLYHDPVARYMPEFGVAMKGAITFHHALTHRAGIPDFYMRWIPPELFVDFDEAIRQICALPLEYYPGAQSAYHPLTVSALFAEVVARVDGRPFPAFCDEEIFGPLGMNRTTWGLPEGAADDWTDVVSNTEAEDDIYHRWARPEMKRSVLPGGGLYSTARDMGRFYAAWCAGGELEGVRILAPATVELAIRRHEDTGVPNSTAGMGYSFSVGVDVKRPFPRGTLASDRSFGHGGASVSSTWADPATGLAVAMLANLNPPAGEHDRRFNLLADVIHRSVVD